MKKQKVREYDTESLLKGLEVNVNFYNYLIEDLFSDMPVVEEDILLLKNKYDLDSDLLDKIEDILRSKSSTKVKMTNKSDMLMSQAFFLKSKIEISKDIYDFETGIVDPYKIIEELKKLEIKLERKLTRERVKAAIDTAISELEGLEQTTANILPKIVKSDKYEVTLKDIELHLKRLESMQSAREKNSKVSSD